MSKRPTAATRCASQARVSSICDGLTASASKFDEFPGFVCVEYAHPQLEGKQEGAPLHGLERGGYRLVYRDTPTDY